MNIEWFGDQAVKVIFEDANGSIQDRLVYRDEEHTPKIVSAGQLDAEVPSGIDKGKSRTLLENASTLGFIDKELN